MKITRREFGIILILFVVTRFALVGFGVVAMRVLPMSEGDQYTHLLDVGAPLDMFYRYDAGFYTSIATFGYKWQTENRLDADLAFLPLYPLSIHLVSGLTPTGCALSDYLSTCATLGGLLVSNVALLASSIFLFDLAKRRWSSAVAFRSVLFLLIAPNIVFMSGVYTESLFLLWAILSFWCLERDRFVPAVIFACCAALTRTVGIAIVPALLWYVWHQPERRRWWRFALALMPGIVFSVYIFGAGLYLGDPMAYFAANRAIWQRDASSPLDAFLVYLRGDVALLGWNPAWIDLVATVYLLVLAVLILRENRLWGVFSVVAVLVPIASGTLLAMPRYGAVIFPIYVYLAQKADTRPKQIGLALASIALGALITSRFVTWRWIA